MAKQRANGYIPLAFNQSTIVSFEPVQHLVGYEPINYEQKTLNTNNLFERTLQQMIERGVNIEQDMKIIHSDIKNNYTYEFEKLPLTL